jgi:hypothetical protein
LPKQHSLLPCKLHLACQLCLAKYSYLFISRITSLSKCTFIVLVRRHEKTCLQVGMQRY